MLAAVSCWWVTLMLGMFRSLLEPIRIANPFVEYCAASCTDVDLERKVLHCTSAVAFEDGSRPEARHTGRGRGGRRAGL